jgi:N-acetylglucosaminyldiphosphoundecaprenol N-acetyl-beta-D-mannosaminyltransferase
VNPLPLRHTSILGYRIVDEPASTIGKAVCDSLGSGDCRSYAFLNPHSIVMASTDEDLQSFFLGGTELFCDGVGLSIANRILNNRRIHRVWGQDFFLAVSRELSARRVGRVMFLGGRESTIEELLRKYRRDFPGISELAHYAPPFKSEFSSSDLAEMRERIVTFRPDVLWVGVGSPKQEKLLQQLQPMCRVPCGAAIGAVFDFYCGHASLGPEWVQRHGLLWAYRLIMEPRRLWRRTLVSAPLFVLRVLREMVHPS